MLNGTNNRVSHNTVMGSGDMGIWLNGSNHNRVEHNTSSSNGEQGLLLDQSKSNRIHGNILRDNGTNGIHLRDGGTHNSYNTLTNNSVTGSSQYGLSVEAGSIRNYYRDNELCDNTVGPASVSANNQSGGNNVDCEGRG